MALKLNNKFSYFSPAVFVELLIVPLIVHLKKFSLFLLSIYDNNESIDFVHGKSKNCFEVLDELELFFR
jgi:hypothetical protein